jgi:hypothetical protein
MRVQGPGSNEIEQSYLTRSINWTHGLETRVQDRRVANPNLGQINMAPLWMENQFVQTKRRAKREIS